MQNARYHKEIFGEYADIQSPALSKRDLALQVQQTRETRLFQGTISKKQIPCHHSAYVLRGHGPIRLRMPWTADDLCTADKARPAWLA
jgi:hypothetical protein